MVKSLSTRVVIIFLLLLRLATGTYGKAFEEAPLSVPECLRLKDNGKAQVFVTVSSLCLKQTDGEVVTRQLEVNWYGIQPRPGDRVGLYNKDPSVGTNVKDPLVVVDSTEYPNGYFRTSVEFPYLYFNISNIAKDSCLGYWVGYMAADGILQSSSCLQTRPFWMEDNRKYLENSTLSSIMIPGSHDSGSFTKYVRNSDSVVSRYKYAQEEPVFNQLLYGLRYFDFRVGFYNQTKERFYINHSYFRTDHPLQRILSEVVNFLKATREIVILDFHNFPVGFDSEDVHTELKNLIISKLGDFLIPHLFNGLEPTIGELWKTNKRVIVSYGHYKPNQINLFWPPIPRAWGNKQHVRDLKKYFEEIFAGPLPKTLWASMAELTPDAKTVIIHPREGLRMFADEVNRNITHWFRDLFWQKANIVATDFFLGNDIVEVAVNINKVKGMCYEIHRAKVREKSIKTNDLPLMTPSCGLR